MPLRVFDILPVVGVCSPEKIVLGIGSLSKRAGALSSPGPSMKRITPARMGTRITKTIFIRLEADRFGP